MRRAILFLLFVLTPVFAFAQFSAIVPFTPVKKWSETGNTKRVALVIGNAAYVHCPKLKSSINDAEAVAKTLKDLGFKVILVKDATRQRMIEAIGQFGAKLTDDCVALAYYSGHGMQVDGVNYLLPVDFDGQTRSDVKFNGVDVNWILDRFDGKGSPINVLILDACRSNPFRSITRVNENGLARMDAPRGTLIAYAAAPSSIVSESEEMNGLYARELLKRMPVPGVKIESIFKQTLESVAERSGEMQQPWMESALQDDLFLVKGGKASIEDAVKLKAHLKVITTPDAAVVKVESVPAPNGVFATPLLDAETKVIKVTVTADGYTPESRNATLKRGVLTMVEVRLEPFALPNDSGNPKTNSQQTPANRWAIIIGIDRYDDTSLNDRLPELTGAVGDANALTAALTQTAGFPTGQVKTLINDKATRRNILRALDRLKTQVTRGDIVFLFFSGHGCEDIDTRKKYMLVYDAATDSIPLLKQTAVDVAEFTEPLRHLPARLIMMSFDMCRVEIGKGGITPLTETVRKGEQDFGLLKDKKSNDDTPDIVVNWWACSAGEKSYEMVAEKRGYFSYFMEQALRGKAAQAGGAVTLADLTKWVPATVAREVLKREGKKQTPRLDFEGVSDLSQLSEIVLTGFTPR